MKGFLGERFLMRVVLVAVLSFAATVVVVKAAPSAPPGPTGYTLEDIYNKYVNGIDAVEGDHPFSPSGPPSASPVTITDIVNSEALEIIPPQRIPLSTGGSRTDGLVRNYTVDTSYEAWDSSAGEYVFQAIVIDHNTGLMWKRCLAGMSGADCSTGTPGAWVPNDARIQCSSTHAGYSGWRLPTIEELTSLIDYSVSVGVKVDQDIFPNFDRSSVWSSTVGDTSGDRWFVQFSGPSTAQYPSHHSFGVLCVRNNT